MHPFAQHRPWFAVVGLCVVALLGSSCSPNKVPDADLVAKVGNREIRLAEFKAEFTRRTRDNPAAVDKLVLLEELISREAMLAKALRLGLDQDAELQRSWQNLLIAKLKERELQPQLEKIEVAAEEIRTRVEASRPRKPRVQSRLALLQLRTHPKMSPQKTAQLAARMAEARENALRLPKDQPGFGLLAMDYSEDQATRFNGGDIGWLEASPDHYRWDPLVVAAGLSLTNIGDVSEVIQAKDGYYLVRLMDRRATESIPVNRAEELARHRLLLEKRKDLERSFIQESRAGVTIAVYTNTLQQWWALEMSSSKPERPIQSLP